MAKKIMAVFGATGAQGGGLARAILNDKNSEFAVRAITRDTNSDKAKALAAMGAEVVAADIDDPKSMQKALEDAYGAYFVTFFWAHFSAEKETAEAKNMAEAAKLAGLKHVIWSTLEDVRNYVPLSDDRMPTLQGKRYRILMAKVKLIISLPMQECQQLSCLLLFIGKTWSILVPAQKEDKMEYWQLHSRWAIRSFRVLRLKILANVLMRYLRKRHHWQEKELELPVVNLHANRWLNR